MKPRGVFKAASCGRSDARRQNAGAGCEDSPDCGSAEHYVAVPADRDATPVRSFPTVTAELHRLADGLTACGVTPVAMASTGVSWIPLYEILEARGVDVVLVNAHHVKNVQGRPSDVVDGQGLQEWHSVGHRDTRSLCPPGPDRRHQGDDGNEPP